MAVRIKGLKTGMLKGFMLYSGAVLVPLLGFATLTMLPTHDVTQLGSNGGSPHPERSAGRDRAAAMVQVVAETRSQPARQRVEAAYDGAVSTHEIGFPSSSKRQ